MELLGLPFGLRLVLHAAAEGKTFPSKGMPETVLIRSFPAFHDIADVAVVAVGPHGFSPPVVTETGL